MSHLVVPSAPLAFMAGGEVAVPLSFVNQLLWEYCRLNGLGWDWMTSEQRQDALDEVDAYINGEFARSLIVHLN